MSRFLKKVKPLRDDQRNRRARTSSTNSGVRKYDLPALFNRLRNHFRRPTTNNPRLVTYLAAGGVHGLRPMRYEKRVARNRFIVLAVVLFVILLGLILAFMPQPLSRRPMKTPLGRTAHFHARRPVRRALFGKGTGGIEFSDR